MAGLLSNEAEAIRKVIAKMMVPDLGQLISAVKIRIARAEAVAYGRQLEAKRILERPSYVDGTEVRAKGPVFWNMVDDLDEAGIKAVLPILEARLEEVRRQYKEYVEERRKEHEASKSTAVFHPSPETWFEPS